MEKLKEMFQRYAETKLIIDSLKSIVKTTNDKIMGILNDIYKDESSPKELYSELADLIHKNVERSNKLNENNDRFINQIIDIGRYIFVNNIVDVTYTEKLDNFIHSITVTIVNKRFTVEILYS